MQHDVTPGADARSDRILDAAAELLASRGYRKVAVDDVARRAGIGKGTVYLHWPTKRELFQAVVLREGITYVNELVAALRFDPEVVRPHRLFTAIYLIIMQRPVLRMLSTWGTPELEGMALERDLGNRELLGHEQLYDLLVAEGLLRSDIPDLKYTLMASNMGFYLMDWLDPSTVEINLQQKADALAYTVKNAFEPRKAPSRAGVRSVAEKMIVLLEAPQAQLRKQIYTYDKKQRTS